MRFLPILLSLLLCSASGLNAQDDKEATAKDYERMIETTFKVEFRELVIETLELDEATIEEFTPLYLNYMESKAELIDERNQLIEEHKGEMSENQSKAQVDDETADFVENYWEIDIDEMQLKKDYFDQFEDIMTYRQAMQFFELEEGFRSRIARAQLIEYVPVLVELEPVYLSYEVEKGDFNNWKTINIDGEVSLDHNFTHDGLTKLLNYASAMVESEGITVPNFQEKKDKILSIADELRTSWTTGDHADMVRKAFNMTASLLGEIREDAGLDVSEEMVQQLEKAAKRINPAELMTAQEEAVYAFFDRAEMLINRLANKAAMQDYERYGMKR